MAKLKFYVEPKKGLKINYPCFIFVYSTWDDYSSKTTFGLSYYKSSSEEIGIGWLKIMHNERWNTIDKIDPVFDSLPAEFCSLGQDMNYYENLKSNFPDNFENILDCLNDAAFFPAVKDTYQNHHRFVNSLLRSSEAEKVFREARFLLEGIPYEKAFQFKYSCLVKNADKEHIAEFNFGDSLDLPSRITGIIGKNGTGKTQFLAKLALDLSGKSQAKDFKDSFTPHRPYFSKIIAVSFSAFDKFSRPQVDKTFSYKYCGIKDEHGRILSLNKTIENIKSAVDKIQELRREDEWFTAFSEILGVNITQELFGFFFESDVDDQTEENFNLLSSGQTYLLSVISDVIATIKPDSLILFDEPEMHLHPNAIANLVRMIDKLLIRFDSYAILATHSPLIVQEIPSRYVLIFEREGNIPRIRKLNIESFGESIDVLSEDVFQTRDVKGTYKEVLENLSQSKGYNEINQMFDKRLSLTAKTYLLGLYPQDN